MDIDLVNRARAYLKVPFRHRGRTSNGLDCAGLVVLCFQDLGRPVIDKKVYGREPHRDGLRQVVEKNSIEKVFSMEPGDIVLMKFVDQPHHLGILGDYFAGGLSLIHSYGEVGRVVEHRLDDVWKSRILDIYRYKGI